MQGYTIAPKGSTLYLVNVLVFVSWMEGKVGDLMWAQPISLERAALKLHIGSAAVGTLLRWHLDLSSEVTDEGAFQVWREGCCVSDKDEEEESQGLPQDSSRSPSTDSASSIASALQALKLQIRRYCSSTSSNAKFLGKLSVDLKSLALEVDRHSGVGNDKQCFHPTTKGRSVTCPSLSPRLHRIRSTHSSFGLISGVN